MAEWKNVILSEVVEFKLNYVLKVLKLTGEDVASCQ